MFVSIFVFGKDTLCIPIIILVYFSKIYSPKYRVLLNIASATFIHMYKIYSIQKKNLKKKKYILLKIAFS